MCRLPASPSARAVRKVLRQADLGPLEAPGELPAGRRMDPRKARHIVERAHSSGPLPLPEPQSSQVLNDYRQGLGEVEFSYAAYAREHPLAVEALKYQYPVKLPTYGLHTQVFADSGIGLCLKDKPHDPVHAVESAGRIRGQTEPRHLGSHLIKDDLMNATASKFIRRKDPVFEEERRRGGPNIWQHSCNHLLCSPVDPNGTILFQELRIQPSVPGALLLPMPLPPTPSVF
ncbi:hypothetical protein ERJ75_001468300 [Trypanosoma vivax]|nr:hypothetical protein ERJ75_001468300 [Trypanosoma vivax]